VVILLTSTPAIMRCCSSSDIDFMSLRFWVGFWLTVILILIVAFDLSFLVRYITRFTEESFAVLISIIFIYEAFSKVAEIYHIYPVGVGYEPGRHNVGPCLCVQPSLNETAYNMTALRASGNLPRTSNVDLLVAPTPPILPSYLPRDAL